MYIAKSSKYKRKRVTKVGKLPELSSVLNLVWPVALLAYMPWREAAAGGSNRSAFISNHK